ncbi:hypothetical protein RJ639_043336 [Escallonia herrerae]|uniref:Bifunctional inhibitor/plant lipid transfer protein/seed storage helical domain-containing protein n=1 Tax=Escallonia herrerae TaxID=1293975 RepID=A0AA88WC12_9ASTE|nr:hypothetical protein RJ639_043336 [Escallonia herrerae]
MASAALSAAKCKVERNAFVSACKLVVNERNPTPECCRCIRVSHFECICPVITPKVAALIDVNHAMRLVEGCGRKVPRQFKCGSKSEFLMLIRVEVFLELCNKIICPDELGDADSKSNDHLQWSPSIRTVGLCYARSLWDKLLSVDN